MSAKKGSYNRADPVTSDQGGRLTQLDPLDSPNAPLQEAIRRKAYEFYEERGKNNGHDLDDWLRAESEVA